MIENASIKCNSSPRKINDARSSRDPILSMWSVSAEKTFEAYKTYEWKRTSDRIIAYPRLPACYKEYKSASI